MLQRTRDRLQSKRNLRLSSNQCVVSRKNNFLFYEIRKFYFFCLLHLFISQFAFILLIYYLPNSVQKQINKLVLSHRNGRLTVRNSWQDAFSQVLNKTEKKSAAKSKCEICIADSLVENLHITERLVC